MGVILYTMEVFDLGGVRMERSGLIGWIGQPSKTWMGGANYRFKEVGANVMWQIYFRNTSLCCGLMYYSKSVGTTRPEFRFVIVKRVKEDLELATTPPALCQQTDQLCGQRHWPN